VCRVAHVEEELPEPRHAFLASETDYRVSVLPLRLPVLAVVGGRVGYDSGVLRG
jgi:hypothetical protein